MQTLQFPTQSEPVHELASQIGVIESPPAKPRVSQAMVIIAILGLALTASVTWQWQRKILEGAHST